MRTTPKDIVYLDPNQIFVFGSNLAGRHGKGAAWDAHNRFSATMGRCHGLDGVCYGIPTKDEQLKTLPLERIVKYVNNMIQDAIDYPEKTFLVTPIGTGLAGYSAEQIAPLFKAAIDVENIWLPDEFWKVLKK